MSLSRPGRPRTSAQASTWDPFSDPPVRSKRNRSVLVFFAVTFALVFTMGSTLAQLPPFPTEPGVNLTATAQSRILSAGECATYDVTVTNSGATVEELDDAPVTAIPEEEVTLTLDTPTQGWTSTLSRNSVELERGESVPVTVRLCAGEDLEGGARGGVSLTATLQPASPADDEQTDTVRLRAEVEEEGMFGLPFDLPSWVLWVVLGALGVMLAAVLVTRRNTGSGVVLECTEPSKEVTPGRGTSFPVRIINEGRSKDLVSLTTSPVPHGWDTFLPIVDVPLEAGDEQTVWISVKSPDEAREGEHVVVKVFARSSSTAGQQAALDLTVTVRGSFFPQQGGGPEGEGPRSVYEPEDTNQRRSVAVKRQKP